MSYPDVIIELRKVLREVTPRVSTIIPNPRPDTFIRISSGGGQVLEHAAQPLIIVECWGATYKAAHDLAHAALKAIQAWADEGDVAHDATLTWPVDYPDPATDSPRFTFNAQVFLLEQ